MQIYNIYPDLTKEAFDQFYKQLKEAILATDLAAYFKVRLKVAQLISDEKFDWNNKRHRSLAKAIMITSCDLSGTCKPFLVAKQICENLCRK